ncbi:MAG: hypothetical protein K0B06_06525 [Brevefilum sp.]|nr:hypothetical protein [Brevefilum sp.]
MAVPFNLRRQRLGAIYGLVAGVAYALTAWGIDGIALAKMHVAFPWIKILPGLVICSLTGCLVGWVSIKISKAIVTIALWIAFGLMLVWLTFWITYQISPLLLKVLKPSLIDWIDYPIVANVNQFKIVGIIVIALPVLVCGLLENNLVDVVLLSSHKGAILSFVLVCGLMMGLAGSAGDELTNKHFREPIQALDDLFQFAIDNQGKEIDKLLFRQKRMKTVEGLEEILPRSRRLTLIAFDENLAQMDILVNFEGVWVKCTTIYSQPIMCKQVLESPVFIVSYR